MSANIKGEAGKQPDNLNPIKPNYWLSIAAALLLLGFWGAYWQPVHPDAYRPPSWRDLFYPNETNAWRRLPALHSRIHDSYTLGDGQHFWAVGDNGLIIYSNDGGANWHAGQVEIPETTAPSRAEFSGFIGNAWADMAPSEYSKQKLQSLEITTSNLINPDSKLKAPQTQSADQPTVEAPTGSIPLDAKAKSKASAKTALSKDTTKAKITATPQPAVATATAKPNLRPVAAPSNDPGNVKDRLNSVFFIDDSHGWAVGDNGTVIATKDGGKHWQRQSSNTGVWLNRVHFSDSRHGWAAGLYGSIIATTDGGQHWQPQDSNTQEWLNAVRFIDNLQGWAVGENGAIMATDDGGQSWRLQASNTRASLNDVYFVDARHGWAVGENGTIVSTDDGGLRWQLQISNTPESLKGIYFSDASHGWAIGGFNGSIVATEDAGLHWQAQISPTNEWLTDIHFVDNQHGWTIGFNGSILDTTDGGKHWQHRSSNLQEWLSAVHFTDSLHGWAVGYGGVILATVDGGESWHTQTSAVAVSLDDVFFIDARQGWAVGGNGVILATDDGGHYWHPQTSNTLEWLHSLHFPDAKHGWAVGADGLIVATDDGGNRWQKQTSNTNNSLMSNHFVDSRRGWAVGGNGSIVFTQDGGKLWQPQISNTKQWLRSVAFVDQLHGWAVGDDDTVKSSNDGGQNWYPQSINLKVRLFGAFFLDRQRGWAVGDNGAIMTTDDGGEHWKQQITSNQARLKSVYFANDRNGWAVGEAGVIIATTDGGQHWQAVQYRKSPGLWVYPVLLLGGAMALFAGYRRLRQQSLAGASSGIMDRAITDKPAGDQDGGGPDLLGARILAAGLVRFLSNHNTLPPITLAITGEWGSGKSSVMNYLSNGLRRNGLTPLWFNAWHHREEQNVLASIFSSLHKQVVGPWWTPGGIWFRLRLLWHRGLLAKTVLSAMAFSLLFSATWLYGHPQERGKVWHYLQYQVGYIEPVLLGEDALDQLCQTPPAIVSQTTTTTTTRKSPDAGGKAQADTRIEDVSKQESRHEPARALFDKSECERLRGSRLIARTILSLSDCLAPGQTAQSSYCFARPGELADQIENRLNRQLTLEDQQSLLAAAAHIHPEFPLPIASKWLSGLLALIGVLLVKAMALVGVAPVKLMQSAMALADGAASSGEAIGTRVMFDKHFKRITQVLGKRRLVLFIDDLDRCDSEHTKRVLEVSNFLSSAGDLFIVLGMAPRYVMANVTLCFEQMARVVKEVDQMNGDTEDHATNSGQSWFARHFLQKLIQIEVPVPEPKPEQVLALLTGEADDAGMNEALRQLKAELEQEERDEQLLNKVLARLSSALTWLMLLAALAVGGFYGAQWQPEARSTIAEQADEKPMVTASPATTPTPIVTSSPNIEPIPKSDNDGPAFEAGQPSDHLADWLAISMPALLFIVSGLLVGLAQEPKRLDSMGLSWLRPLIQRLKIRLFGPQTTLDSNDFADALKIWYPLIAMANPIPRNIKTFVNQLRYYASRQNPTGIGDGQEAQLVAMAVAYYAFGEDMDLLFDIAVDMQGQRQFLKEKIAKLNQRHNGLLLNAVTAHQQRFTRLPTEEERQQFKENHQLITIQRRNTMFEKTGQ